MVMKIAPLALKIVEPVHHPPNFAVIRSVRLAKIVLAALQIVADVLRVVMDDVILQMVKLVATAFKTVVLAQFLDVAMEIVISTLTKTVLPALKTVVFAT